MQSSARIANAAEMAVEAEVREALNDVCVRVEAEALAYPLDDGAAVIAWDTETTGLNGVVVQLGVVVLDRDGREVLAHSRILAPLPNWPIQQGAFQVHGISEERQRLEGEPVRQSLEAFATLASVAQTRGVPLVAHNAAFDKRMLRNTAREAGCAIGDVESKCTMMLGKRVMQAKRGGVAKRPKNSELYEVLLGEAPNEDILHDATEDARLTARSYLRGHQEGFW